MPNELNEIMSGLQEAYEQAESRNEPPEGDSRYSVIIKKIKEISFCKDEADFVSLVPVYEILDGDQAGWVMDGDRGLLGPADDQGVQMGLRDLKILAKVLNGGKPLGVISDAVAIIKGSVGSQLMVEVRHIVSKKGQEFANVKPKELLVAG